MDSTIDIDGVSYNGKPKLQPDPSPVSVRDWFLILLVLSIPFLNWILILSWAFAPETNINKKNFCKAALLWAVIITILSLLSIVP